MPSPSTTSESAPKRKAAKKPARKRSASAALPREAGDSGRLVVVQNLGPIAKAELRLKPLTVLAGPNKTGKTFVSKGLYSVFRAMHDNHAKVFFEEHAEQVMGAAQRLRWVMPTAIRHGVRPRPVKENEEEDVSLFSFFPMLHGRLKSIGETASSMPLDGTKHQVEKIAADLTAECGKLMSFYQANEKALIGAAQQRGKREEAALRRYVGKPRPLYIRVSDAAESLKQSILALRKIKWEDTSFMAQRGLARAFYQRAVANFQSPVSRLLTNMKGTARIEIEGAPFFQISKDGVDCQNLKGFPLPQGRAPVFLEFPGAYWKLREALEGMRFDLSSVDPDELDGTPQYFYDLAGTLKLKEFPPSVFPDANECLESTIGGKIDLSETGELMFQEKKGGFPTPMHTTAAGVINLGVLSLLIEKARIEGDMFVFIDEPEINLHPEWQVKMAETLYELARGGVNIVFATHSIDILKRLEIYAKEDPNAERLIAVNHFRKDGIVEDNGKSLDAKISAVMEELSSPFFGLYVRGL